MIKFLLVIFMFFVLLVFLLGFSIIRSFKNMLFGSNKSSSTQQQRASAKTGQQKQQRASRAEESAQSKKKLFNKDEGEYVDYEEVK